MTDQKDPNFISTARQNRILPEDSFGDWKWREALAETPFMTEYEWLQAISADNKQGNITSKECSELVKKTSL